MFFIAMGLTIGLVYIFSGFRLITPLPLGARWKAGLWGIVALCFAVLLLTVTARHTTPGHGHGFPPAIAWIAFTALGFITLIFPGILLKDVCLGIHALIRTLLFKKKRCPENGQQRQNRPEREPFADLNPSRRNFLTNAGNAALTGTAFVLTGYGIHRATRTPEVVKVEIPIKNLAAPFNGFTILQISDLHISLTLKKRYVQAVVARAAREEADMIALTGDLADGSEAEMGGDAAPLSDLNAPYGKYFVTGNHDYYSGALAWLNRLQRLGFTPLINEHRIIERQTARIVLAGVTDYRAGRIIPGHASDPGKALEGAPSSIPRIMLAHQPKSVFKAARLGLDLMICGHTHGGQYIPWNFLVPLDQPYVHGLCQHNATQLYVNRGTGYWGPPLRIGAPPEITLIRLVSAPPAQG